jgi:hypothetical protein
MAFIDKIKGFFKKSGSKSSKAKETPNYISIMSMETKFENDDLIGAAKDLKSLLEAYGRRKRKNHRYKGREFIYFVLSNKHKDLKNIGYTHWQHLDQYIKLNTTKVYPYHKKNIRNAMSFFEKEVKGLSEIKIPVMQ